MNARMLAYALALNLGLVHAVHAAEPTPEPEEPGMPRAARITLETLGGYGGAAVGGLLGYGLALPAVGSGDFAGLAAAFVGGIPGAAIGLPTGIYLTGEACGGDGNYWVTWAGVLAGSVVPFLVSYATAGDDGWEGTQIALWATLPVAGGIIGYELSQRERSASSLPAARPWLAPLEGGVALGIGGSF